ncbi:MAG TPA: right-handed parallel beta-helix repeat-containing protein, partial [Ginsengibacter sp.]
MLRFCCYIFLIFSACNKSTSTNTVNKAHSYYFSNSGNDENEGSIEHPFKTIEHFNSIHISPGDEVFFKGGEIFTGNLVLDSTKSGTKDKPVVLSSYGNGNPIIDATNGTALTIYNSSYINITDITCKGSGRKDGNTKPGILISNCINISVVKLDISGFQKSGLQLYSCKNLTVDNVNAHDNGAAGIGVEGIYNSKLSSNNIRITHCIAENNPGDPTNLTNHSGNGIIVGHCTNVMIDYCMATNNGWDMPRIGNGPVGIWCYEADSVVIQHCLSYKNKTSKGGEDGGGYDHDGGVTNSIIQYCLSYENDGSAFGIFQYAGATNWHDNTIRYCISENDG